MQTKSEAVHAERLFWSWRFAHSFARQKNTSEQSKMSKQVASQFTLFPNTNAPWKSFTCIWTQFFPTNLGVGFPVGIPCRFDTPHLSAVLPPPSRAAVAVVASPIIQSGWKFVEICGHGRLIMIRQVSRFEHVRRIQKTWNDMDTMEISPKKCYRLYLCGFGCMFGTSFFWSVALPHVMNVMLNNTSGCLKIWHGICVT